MKKTSSPACSNCGQDGVSLYPCSRCKLVRYCGKECQKHHWKDHKPHCVDVKNRAPSSVALPKAERECAICLAEIDEVANCLLPCGHEFHVDCVKELQKSSDKCPNCRATIPDIELLIEELNSLVTGDMTVEEARLLPKPIIDRVTGLLVMIADMGNRQAAFMLAMDSSVPGFFPCKERYVKYVVKSAKQGNRDAQCILGIYYSRGVYCFPKSIAEAKKWFKMSASQGGVDSQFRLGVIMVASEDIGEVNEGVMLILMAAKNGHEEALKYT